MGPSCEKVNYHFFARSRSSVIANYFGFHKGCTNNKYMHMTYLYSFIRSECGSIMRVKAEVKALVVGCSGECDGIDGDGGILYSLSMSAFLAIMI